VDAKQAAVTKLLVLNLNFIFLSPSFDVN